MKKFLRYAILFFLLLAPSQAALAEAGVAELVEQEIGSRLEAPYSLGPVPSHIQPGQSFLALFSIESHSRQGRQIPIQLDLPAGFQFKNASTAWQTESSNADTAQHISRRLELAEGYGQWFDLLEIMVDPEMSEGIYSIRWRAGDSEQILSIRLNKAAAGLQRQAPALKSVILPLDKDGKRNEKQGLNTLVLRDRSLDYFKNVLRGKGATNLEIEAIHPLAHMGLDFDNPAGQHKLLRVEAELLDQNTRRRVAGFYTPGNHSDQNGAGAMAAKQDCLTAFVALTGESQQRLTLPIYADETLLTEGNYWLRITAEDGQAQVWSQEVPLRLIKKNFVGLYTVGAGLFILILFAVILRLRLPEVMAGLRTRRLITIALFGTCAFAVVNVPSTLLKDILHIFLGPFSFLISGMFSEIILYMLLGALVTLIPVYGAISLMLMVRLLLGMVAFGHMSPIVFLSFGVNAFLLEATLALTGFTRGKLQDGGKLQFSWRRAAVLAMACAFADTAATFVTLQSMAVLYRLFFAEWYIALVMLINGFLYTLIGAGCGAWLGTRLSEVGSD